MLQGYKVEPFQTGSINHIGIQYLSISVYSRFEFKVTRSNQAQLYKILKMLVTWHTRSQSNYSYGSDGVFYMADTAKMCGDVSYDGSQKANPGN